MGSSSGLVLWGYRGVIKTTFGGNFVGGHMLAMMDCHYGVLV